MERILDLVSWHLFGIILAFMIFMAGVQVGKKLERGVKMEMVPPWAGEKLLSSNLEGKEF